MVTTEPRRVAVRTCRTCPGHHRVSVPFHDMFMEICVFDVDRRIPGGGGPPDWCPLRAAPVLVALGTP
jgi:hypothetical protein